MSNLKSVKPRVQTITLKDGVERELRFTLNAMAALEDAYGSVEKAFEALENNSIKALRCVLWAGLIDHDPSLTEQKVGSLIDLESIDTVMKTLTDSIDADMPEAGTTAAEVAALPNA